ncbi:MAG: 4Fe-4S binding protein [Lachnospiraceae bacterium]|nr:4Fe-4S binding protein [Lachnospiraceae bacterium]
MAKRMRKTAVVHCRGGCGSEDGKRLCPDGCIGCGACVKACRKQALTLSDEPGAVPSVDRDKCVGCGLCVRACPRNVIRLEAADNVIQPLCSLQSGGAEAKKICPNSCISCRICEKNCPAGAMSLAGGAPHIDPELCIGCGMCAVKCPRGAIGDANGIFGVRC